VTAVKFDIPPNACDCATHIFGDPGKFRLSPERVFTPDIALPEEMAALHRVLHMKRAVIVTSNAYGNDNSVTLHGIQARGIDARGVAVIDDQSSEEDFKRMSRGGICAVRINLRTVKDPAIGRKSFQAVVDRLKKNNWHVEIYATPPLIAGMKDLLQDSPVPVVLDHFGGLQAALGLDQPGFSDVVDLVRSGKAYVKISAAYRLSTQGPDYPDMAPFAKALIAANADCSLWGSDWPHPNGARLPGHPVTDVTPPFQIDDGRLLNQLAVWAPDPAIRKKILVDNPARIYRF